MTVSHLSLSLLRQAFKKVCFILLLTQSLTAFAQLKVNNIGYIGIGNNSPTYKLDVEGTVRYSNWTDVILNWSGLSGGPVMYPEQDWYLQLGKSTNRIGNIFVTGIHTNNLWYDSDAEVKQEIQSVKSAVKLVQALNGKTYRFKDYFFENLPEVEKKIYTRTQFGFIAEELEQVLPSLVYTDSGTTHSRINYIGIIPILVEAIKEQQLLIDRFAETQYVKKDISAGTFELINKENEAFLLQNIPNPYTEKTEIKFNVPQSASIAMILIYNLNGEQLKKYTFSSHGKQSIVINGNEFNAGSYYYTLIVDNKEVDTKKMILVK